jgi:hypothetical protein
MDVNKRKNTDIINTSHLRIAVHGCADGLQVLERHHLIEAKTRRVQMSAVLVCENEGEEDRERESVHGAVGEAQVIGESEHRQLVDGQRKSAIVLQEAHNYE